MAQGSGGTQNFAGASSETPNYIGSGMGSGMGQPTGNSYGFNPIAGGPQKAPGQTASNMPYADMENGGQTGGNAMADNYGQLSTTPVASSFPNGQPQGYFGGGGYQNANIGYGNDGVNPYTDQVAASLTASSNKNLTENILPSINRSANAVGGYGGARQGLAQGNAIGGAQAGLDSAIANMRSGAFENAANRSLQASAINNQSGQAWMNYDLGRRGLDQSGENSLRNFYSTNRGQDLQELLAGSGLLQQGNAGLLGQGQGIYGLGATEQGAGQNQLSWLSSILGGYAGLGATNTSTQQYQYNPLMQAAGLGIGAAGALGGLGFKPFGSSGGSGSFPSAYGSPYG